MATAEEIIKTLIDEVTGLEHALAVEAAFDWIRRHEKILLTEGVIKGVINAESKKLDGSKEFDEDDALRIKELVSTNAEYRYSFIAQTSLTSPRFNRDNICQVVVDLYKLGLCRIDKGKDKCAILSAGCSTGEEVYSVATAMLDAEYGPNDFFVHGIDINQAALKIAKKGRYTSSDILGRAMLGKGVLRSEVMDSFFIKNCLGTSSGYETIYTPSPILKEVIAFTPCNIADTADVANVLNDQQYHIILCRNLIKYFSIQRGCEIIQRFKSHLVNGGFFVIGTEKDGERPMAEYGIPDFRQVSEVQSFVYQRTD